MEILGAILLIIIVFYVVVYFISSMNSDNKKTEHKNDSQSKRFEDMANYDSQILSHYNSKNNGNVNDVKLDSYRKESDTKKEFSTHTIYKRGSTFFKSDTNEPYYFIFDCETTGIPGDGKVVRIVQLAWLILDKDFCEVKSESFYLNPGKPIPEESTLIHHITDEIVKEKSKPHIEVLTKFYTDLESCMWIIAHNFSFDAGRVDLETRKVKLEKASLLDHKKSICTMEKGTNYCKLTPKVYGEYKWPNLDELASCCGFRASGLHDALNDTYITAKCFEIMVQEKYIKRKGINL